MIFDICYSVDSKYIEQLLVSITSVLKNSDYDDYFNFYVLHCCLSEQAKIYFEKLKEIKNFNINFIYVNEYDFINCPMRENYHVTKATYYRFCLPYYLPFVKKILYLDCDTLIQCSLKKLFETDITKYAALMCPDAESKNEAERLGINTYYNAGVILINLDFWRENNISFKLFDYAENNKEIIKWQDQDIINCVLKNNIGTLDTIWNFQYFLYSDVNISELSDCKIIHLAGMFKPWLMYFEHPLYDCYYYYLSMTPFKNKILEYQLRGKHKFLKDNLGGSVTKILVNAFDEDIQGCYREIDNIYRYISNVNEGLINKIDKKIHNVYQEISKNYQYTNDIRDNLEKEIKENIKV